jgi:hypothetical protein
VTNANDTPLDRIREYLGGLTSRARSSLLVEIERIQLYGEEIPGSDIILAELRAEFPNSEKPEARLSEPGRLFFKAIESLIVDRSPERANSGEISRGSLSAIWDWINQLLLPSMAGDYCEKMKSAIRKNDPREVKALVAGFQFKVTKCLDGLLSSDDGIETARTGLGQFTSSRATLNDLTKIHSALRVADPIGAFAAALPAKVKKLDGEPLTKIKGLLDGLHAKHPAAIPFALTLVMQHLNTPWQLVHLATRVSRSKAVEDVKATRYASSVSMVLDLLEDKRIMLREALKTNRVVIAKQLLTGIYDIERALRGRIDRLDKSDWGQRLDALMAAIAADLQAEFKTLPGDTQHVLGSRTLNRYGSASGLLSAFVQKGRDLIGIGA